MPETVEGIIASVSGPSHLPLMSAAPTNTPLESTLVCLYAVQSMTKTVHPPPSHQVCISGRRAIEDYTTDPQAVQHER
jgi:hypothetical protein